MKPLDLINLQITLEYQLDCAGNLVPYEGSTEQARCIVYQYGDGYQRYLRYDLPASLKSKLVELAPRQAFEQPEAIRSVLAPDGSAPPPGVFVSCYFNHTPSIDEFPLVDQREGCFIISIVGQPVAWAWSERSNSDCAEIAVETSPEFRRHGYARQVCAAWANHTLSQGKVAFFSHDVDNFPSQALANRLGVVRYALCTAYD